MICPGCKAEGKTSKIRVGTGTRTLAAYRPFYDEVGEYHEHDHNTVIRELRCTNGHAWTQNIPHRCPNPKCDWTSNG